VGVVLAMLPLAGIVAQPVWGQLADRTGSRSGVLAWLGIGALLGYLALFSAQGFAAILLATAALACFQAPLIPATVSVTLALTRDAGPHAFGHMRVWGTVGFFICVVAFPPALHAVQELRGLVTDAAGVSQPGLEVMFPAAGALLLLGALVAFALPRRGAISLRAPRGDWHRLLRHGPFLRLLAFSLVAYLCLQGPMSLFPIFVRAHGGIPLIALSGAGLARLGPRGLLAVGVLAGGLRWTVCGLAPSLAWIYPVQMLHGVVVAGLVIGGPLYVEAAVPERLRSTGQGILAMVGVSVGGISSQLVAGWLLEHVGPNAPYIAGGIGALLLGALVPFLLPPASRPPAAEGEGE
jgi:PPP family 3-phenylpropionic acid transporter